MTSTIENNESTSYLRVIRGSFLVRPNLRRVLLTIAAYILAQMPGDNSITDYLPTIFVLVGIQGSGVRVYISGLYAMAKLVCCMAASLILVDLAGRRRFLMLGVGIQIICPSY